MARPWTVDPAYPVIERLFYNEGRSIQSIADEIGQPATFVSDLLEGRGRVDCYSSPFKKVNMRKARASVGPAGGELFNQGTCRMCGVGLFGPKDEPRAFCGLCDPRNGLCGLPGGE